MYYCGKYPIIEKKALGAEIYSVTALAPEQANAAEIGQFANILAPGFTLRRPISICEINKERGTLRFVFEVRGKGTDSISRLGVGDSLDILGPLGNGFKLPESGKIIVVGGGIGVPPLLGAAYAAKDRCAAIIGFRDYSKIILANEFQKTGAEVVVCTDDGSVGRKGLVTLPLAEILDNNTDAAVLACGPAPMLRAIAELCEKRGVSCQVSLEQRMGCGVGACVVCSCMTVRDGKEFYARVCKDGPVFDSREVRL